MEGEETGEANACHRKGQKANFEWRKPKKQGKPYDLKCKQGFIKLTERKTN